MKAARTPLSRLLRDAFRLEPLEARVLLSADPVLGAAQVALRPPVDDAQKALIDAYTASADLVVQAPANATVLITNGPAQNAQPGWLVVDTSQLAGGHGTLVVGGLDSNAKVLIGETGGAAINLDNLVIVNPQLGGEIVQNVAVNVTGGMLVVGSGHTLLVGADVNNGTTSYITNDSVSVAGARTVAVNAAADLGFNGGFISGDENGVKDDSLTLQVAGTVRFSAEIGQNKDFPVGDNSLLAGLTIDGFTTGGVTDLPNSVTFDRAVRLAGDLVIRVQAGGTVTFNDTLDLVDGGNLVIYGARSVQFASAVKLAGVHSGAAGNILIEGDVIDLPSTSSSVEGQGTITLRPTTKTANIEVGLPSFDPSALNLDVLELKALKDGFSTVVIGYNDGVHASTGTGDVRVGGAVNAVLFRDNVEIYGKTILVEDSSLSNTYLQASGSIKLDALQDITIQNRVFALGAALTGVSDITLYSANGGIVQRDAQDPYDNDGTTGTAISEVLRGNTLTARAATGILLPFTDVVAVNATNTTSGSITIIELANAVTGTTGGDLTVNRLDQQAGGGAVSVSTSAGSITVAGLVTSQGTGSTAIEAKGSGKTLTINQAISTTAGAISLKANGAVATNDDGTTTDGTVTTTGAFDITLESVAASVRQGSQVSSAGGTVTLKASTNVTMDDGVLLRSLGVNGSAVLQATTGKVDVSMVRADKAITLSAGTTILDVLTGNAPNLDGETATVLLTAATGIGTSLSALQTRVQALGASTTSSVTGGIYIREATALRLTRDIGTVAIQATAGPVVIVTTEGSITVEKTISTSGTAGHVLLQAGETVEGTDSALLLRANVSTIDGSISLVSADGIVVDDQLLGTAPTVTVGGATRTLDVQAADGIAMEGAARFATAGGAVRIVAQGGSIALGVVDAAGGTISVTASGDITDAAADDATPVANLVGGSLRLSAGGAIGASGSLLDTQVTTVAAAATSGAMFLAEKDALAVGSIAALTVNRVQVDGTTATVSDAAALAGLSAGGVLVLQAGGDLAFNQGLTAAGNVGIVTTGKLDVATGTTVTSSTSHVSAVAAGAVTLAANSLVWAQGGTLDLESTAGAIAMAGSAVLRTNAASLRAKAQGTVTVGVLDARSTADRGTGLTTGQSGWGDASVVATGATSAIADLAGDLTVDVYARGLRLQAGGGIGAGTEQLETEVATLSAVTGAGGLFITESTALVLGPTADVSVNRVAVGGGNGTLQTDTAQAGVSSGGAVVVQTTAGSLGSTGAVTASGAGNVLLASGGAFDLSIGAAAGSATGNVSLLSGRDLLLAAGVSAGGSGTVDLLAQRDLVQSQNTSVTSGGGNIGIQAVTGNATLETIDAGTGGIWASAVNIVNADVAGGETDLVAGSAQLLATGAGGSIGAAAAHLGTSVTTLTARAGNGVFLTELNGVTVDKLTVDVRRVAADGSSSLSAHAAQEDLAGAVVALTATAGNLTVNAGTAASAGVTGGTGSVRLQAAAGTVALAAAIDGGSGPVTVLGATGVSFTAAAGITTSGSGTIDIESSGGSIAMADGSAAATTGGNIRVAALNDISVGLLDARTAAGRAGPGAVADQANWGAVSVNAGGSITDNPGETAVDVYAGALRLQAGSAAGIGAPTEHLETEVALLSVLAGAGSVFVDEGTAVSVGTTALIGVNRVGVDGSSVSTTSDAIQSGLLAGNAAVLVTAAGGITVQNLVSAGSNLLLQAAGSANDLTLGAAVGSIGGNVTLAASGSLAANAAISTTAVGKTIEITAQGTILQAQGTLISTNAGSLALVAGGAVTLEELKAVGADVLVQGSAIIDGDAVADEAEVDITAGTLRLVGTTGIGGFATPLVTKVGTLAASTSGNLFIVERDDLTIGTTSDVLVQHVGAAGTTSDASRSAASGLSGATVVVRTVDGSLTTSGTGTVGATANLLLQAAGTARDVTLGTTTSAAGAISVQASRDITLTSSVTATVTGSTIDLQAARSIDAQQTSAIVAKDANVQLLAGTGTATLESIDAGTGSVGISGTSVLDGDVAGDAEVDIVAAALQLTATAGSAGLLANALEVKVDTLSVSATTIVAVTESDALLLDTVGVGVDRVGSDGAKAATTTVSQSNVTGGTTVVLRTLAGSLSSTASGGAATATAGNLLLKAGGTGSDLVLAGAVTSGANLSLDAARDLQQNADVIATGTADLLAGGAIVQAQGTQLKTSGSDAMLVAGGSVTVETITTGIGRVSITGTSILDGDALPDSEIDIAAGGLRATATSGSIGTAANPLETKISTLTAVASGDLFISESDALDLGGVAVSVNRVTSLGTLSATAAPLQGGVSGGTVVIGTLGGNLATLAGTGIVAATGNLLLQALGATSNLQLSAAVSSTTGSISLDAGQDLLLGANVTAQGAGQSIDLLAQRNVVQSQGTSASTSNGAISLQAVTGDATIELLAAGTAGVRVAAANIIDGDGAGDSETDITAGDLQLLATGSIGAVGRLETDVARLSAQGVGTVLVDEANALLVGSVQVNVQRVALAGTSAATANAAQAGVAGGNVVLRTTAGALEVEAGAPVAVTGNLLLKAGGTGGDLTIGAAVGSTGGVVSLDAGRDLVLASSLTTTNTAIDVLAAGQLTTQQGSAIQSGGASVLLQAGGTLTLESVDAGAGTVRLAAASIVDGDALPDTEVDVVASALQVVTTLGVGSAANPLDLQVATLTVSAGAGIFASEADALAIDAVTFNGKRTDSLGAATTTGPFTQSDVATTSGNIALVAQGNVDLPANADVRTTGTGTIDITSVNGTVLMQAGSPGQSQVQTGSGNIHVMAKGDIRPGALLTSGQAVLDSTDGSILVAGDLQRNGEDINLVGDDVVITVPVSSPGATLTVGPLTSGVPVVIGDVPHVVPSLQLDTAELALLQDGFAQIVIGSTLANQVVDLQGGTPLVFHDPVVLDASGTGGTVAITGTLQAESLQVRDSGGGSATGTTLTDSTLELVGGAVIGDEVVVSGANTIHTGTGGSGNLQVTKAITGLGGAGDTLTLQADGGNISLDGPVSGLDGLTVDQAVNVTFGAAVSVTGDLTINATGVVTFTGPLTLANGGRLIVHGGGQVVFANSADLGSGDALLEVSGLQATGGAGSVTGTGLLEVRGTTPAMGIHLGSGTVPAGALQVGNTALLAIGNGFSTVRIGSAASVAAGAVGIGNADLTSTTSPLEILGSSIAVSATGTGLRLGGNATLHAAGSISTAGQVVATHSADLFVTSDAGAISMAAGASIASLGGRIDLVAATGIAVAGVDARNGAGPAGVVTIRSTGGVVSDANGDTGVDVFARAVEFQAYGPTAGTGNAIEVAAELVNVDVPAGLVLRESGADGRTYFNVLRGGVLTQALVAVGPTARVTTDPYVVLADPNLLHAAESSLPTTQSLNLLAQQYQASLPSAGAFFSSGSSSATGIVMDVPQVRGYLAQGVSMVAPDLSFSQRLLADSGLSFASGQPSGDGSTADYWSESLNV